MFFVPFLHDWAMILVKADSKGRGTPCSVVGLGQCALDFLGEVQSYPSVDAKAELSSSSVQGGGPVATALVTLARLGVKTAFIGRVGDDEFGRHIRRGLAGESVDCAQLKEVAGAVSQHAWIVIEKGTGHRNIFWHRGTCPPLNAEELDEATIGNCRVLHLDGLQLEASIAAGRIARKHGVTTVLDGGTLRPGTEKLLPFIDHPVVSERFASALAEGQGVDVALDRLLAYGAHAATVTCGVNGSVSLTDDGERFEQPAFAVDAVDTTGCGDVFHGGYIYGLLQRWPLTRTLRFASACAALKTRRVGGRTAIPQLDEVERFLEG